MEASTVDAVVDALRALLEDPAFRRLDGSFAAAFEAAIEAASALWTAKPHPRFAADAPGASKPLCGVKGDWVSEVRAKMEAGEVEPYVPDEA